jgi:hypothetical protein
MPTGTVTTLGNWFATNVVRGWAQGISFPCDRNREAVQQAAGLLIGALAQSDYAED